MRFLLTVAVTVSLALLAVKYRADLSQHFHETRRRPEIRKVEGKARTALAQKLQEAADKAKAGVKQ